MKPKYLLGDLHVVRSLHFGSWLLSFVSVNVQALFDPIWLTGISLTAGGCSGIKQCSTINRHRSPFMARYYQKGHNWTIIASWIYITNSYFTNSLSDWHHIISTLMPPWRTWYFRLQISERKLLLLVKILLMFTTTQHKYALHEW